LGLHSFPESQVDNAAANPGNEAGRVGKIDNCNEESVTDDFRRRSGLYVHQLKTTEPEFATFRYASAQKSDEQPTATYGTPDFVHFLNMRGALPERASE